jgi:hypothetical protein
MTSLDRRADVSHEGKERTPASRRGVSSPVGPVRPSAGWRSPPRGEKRGDR